VGLSLRSLKTPLLPLFGESWPLVEAFHLLVVGAKASEAVCSLSVSCHASLLLKGNLISEDCIIFLLILCSCPTLGTESCGKGLKN